MRHPLSTGVDTPYNWLKVSKTTLICPLDNRVRVVNIAPGVW